MSSKVSRVGTPAVGNGKPSCWGTPSLSVAQTLPGCFLRSRGSWVFCRNGIRVLELG